MKTGQNGKYDIPYFREYIVSAGNILFWKLECGKYSREETIIFFYFLDAATIQVWYTYTYVGNT